MSGALRKSQIASEVLVRRLSSAAAVRVGPPLASLISSKKRSRFAAAMVTSSGRASATGVGVRPPVAVPEPTSGSSAQVPAK